MSEYGYLVDFVRSLYTTEKPIPLHAPTFAGNEKEYLCECIDSTFVSSVGPFVDRFEAMMRELTGARYAVAATNGTAALHMALILAGVQANDEVITQPLTFVATCNAIAYQHAHPLFVDVDRETLGLSPTSLREFLQSQVEKTAQGCRNRANGRRIAAVLVMHTFGHPARLDELSEICKEWQLPLIEDAAESMGSYYHGQHTGTFGLLGAFSFNGNKIITSGGGGCIVTNDERLGKLAKHLTTTAKVPHPWEFFHDHIGYNYRLPNINAALACAQLEQLDRFLQSKRELAGAYQMFCQQKGLTFVAEPEGCRSNYWLNAIITTSYEERNAMLTATNKAGVMTRPIWTLMHRLPAYEKCARGPLINSEWLEARVVNLPSSTRI
jgi:aminotransferase in exopolysaccharide biosynthesis